MTPLSRTALCAFLIIAFPAPSFAGTMPDMEGMDMSAPGDHDMGSMQGVFGSYPMTREASGTSWQPDSTPHQGLHFSLDDWSLMAHGVVNGVFDSQGGKRGADQAFSSSMAMLMARHSLGENGTLQLRTMLSLDALMGSNGYPLLFATGESADGHDAITDRQHPHDLFMEMAAMYGYRFSEKSSAFVYAGLPGEPALGPVTFMHRFSGMDNPEAPIAHHWLDSTHVTFGVLTAGYVYDRWKIEASAFKGREPDEHRFDIESPKLDSFSTRISFNPSANWSFQASWGYLKSPEELAPNVNENRVTASGTYNLPFGTNDWSTTLAWGRKMESPGDSLDGFLLESAVVLDDTHTFFGRAERVAEDELLETVPMPGTVTVNKLSLGYIRDFHIADHLKFGVGGLVSRYAYPGSLDSVYGSDPTSYMLFVRLKLM